MGHFCFIDEITEVKKHEKLSARYVLKGDEEFLEDHFHGFPVMPGVLLLESLKQAASLLLLLSEDFKQPFFRLREASEIKYGQFVKPGDLLSLTARLVRREQAAVFFDGRIDLVEKGKALTAAFSLVPVDCSAEEKELLISRSRRLVEGIS